METIPTAASQPRTSGRAPAQSELAGTAGLATRPPDEEERKKLRRLGDSPLIASLTLAEGGTVEVAAKREDTADLVGPFAGRAADVGALSNTR